MKNCVNEIISPLSVRNEESVCASRINIDVDGPSARRLVFFSVPVLLCLLSCGGGGSSSGNNSNTPNPPVISAISAVPTSTTVTINWTTDETSSSNVNYGTTASYGKTFSNSSLVTSHTVQLTGLACSTTYHYQVSSTNSTGQSSTSSDQTFLTGSTGDPNVNCAPISDNFDSSTLNTALWTIVDSAGDAVVTLNGSAATISLPQGSVHDQLAPSSPPVQVLENITDTDFQVQARFQSTVAIGIQEEGISARQDANNSVAFKVYSDGTNVHIYAGQTINGTETSINDAVINVTQAPIWLQLERSGNNWVGKWSLDGVNFTTASSFPLTLAITGVGPFAGNYNVATTSTPAFTAIVDYFYNVASPAASNQDGPALFSAVTVDANPPSTLLEKTLADIEGTGHLNPVAGFGVGPGSPTDGIYWYGYPASGVLTDPWPKYTIVGDGDAYGDMVALDVNGDGAVDIVASYITGPNGISTIVWFENPRGQGGDPTTATWNMHTIGPGLSSSSENNLIIADIDGDGLLDVVTPSYIYFQNTADSWTPVQYNSATRGVALLDIGSGKGSINIVSTLANSTATYNAVWFENPRETGGNARTGSWITHNIGPTYPCTATSCPTGDMYIAAYGSGDLNGDGRMDIVMGQSEGPNGALPPAGGLIWFEAPADRRNGTWTATTIDASFSDTQTIRVVDMDQKGYLDLVTAEQDQSIFRRVSVFHNDGQGNFTQEILSNAAGDDICVGNARGTGALDILNSGHGAFGMIHPLQLFLNPISGPASNPATVTTRSTHSPKSTIPRPPSPAPDLLQTPQDFKNNRSF
jgi:hypothetical protein